MHRSVSNMFQVYRQAIILVVTSITGWITSFATRTSPFPTATSNNAIFKASMKFLLASSLRVLQVHRAALITMAFPVIGARFRKCAQSSAALDPIVTIYKLKSASSSLICGMTISASMMSCYVRCWLRLLQISYNFEVCSFHQFWPGSNDGNGRYAGIWPISNVSTSGENVGRKQLLSSGWCDSFYCHEAHCAQHRPDQNAPVSLLEGCSNWHLAYFGFTGLAQIYGGGILVYYQPVACF